MTHDRDRVNGNANANGSTTLRTLDDDDDFDDFMNDDEGDLICSQITPSSIDPSGHNLSIYSNTRYIPHAAVPVKAAQPSHKQSVFKTPAPPQSQCPACGNATKQLIDALNGQVGVQQDTINQLNLDIRRLKQEIANLKKTNDDKIKVSIEQIAHEKKMQALEYDAKLESKDSELREARYEAEKAQNEKKKLEGQIKVLNNQVAILMRDHSQRLAQHIEDAEPLKKKFKTGNTGHDRDSGCGSSKESTHAFDEKIEEVLSAYGIMVIPQQAREIGEEIKSKSMGFKEALFLVDKLLGSERLIRGQLEEVPLSECVSCSRFEEPDINGGIEMDPYANHSIQNPPPPNLKPCYVTKFIHSGPLFKVFNMFKDLETKVMEGNQIKDEEMRAFLLVLRIFNSLLSKSVRELIAFKPGCQCWFKFINGLINCYSMMLDYYEPSDDLADIYYQTFTQVAKSQWIPVLIIKSVNLIKGIRPICIDLLRTWFASVQAVSGTIQILNQDRSSIKNSLQYIEAKCAKLEN